MFVLSSFVEGNVTQLLIGRKCGVIYSISLIHVDRSWKESLTVWAEGGIFTGDPVQPSMQILKRQYGFEVIVGGWRVGVAPPR